MFWLKKLLGALLQPLTVVILLQLLGFILLLRRQKRAGLACLISSWLLLITASNEGIADNLILRLESQYPPAYATAVLPIPPALATCEYIAVLGGGHKHDTAQSAVGRLAPSSLGRLTEAVRLARSMPSSRLLLCGYTSDDYPESHAEVLALAAVELGIDRTRITLLADVRDTHDEVHAIHAITGDKPVALITSAWHMPRAMGLATKAGLNAVACPADFNLAPNGERPNPWFNWSLAGLERSSLATREALGLLWTRMRGQR
ncbi:ElyC/SanA/YdcF family protein [Synoicihabitans lomoniglobus]|uniref:ElyC/SanA/YdcF family protein n=1 Tax=Synoicihabitans lomoniglobus TaxID=2909285 RepID=A0AAF0CRE5_9BACT|nr:YdcF family protein [Opitutaceae bacterium LMO-M01]WED66652.1 ElyC/SanA/YdcF family protein [Opitutaceae bacterium LMO-M01]